ncbi:MAG: AAA family ATPase, partial [Thermodesulfobacteriota bacterium]|nr:AAA family ATPase [Thermodesulfobacteriota bacterium]
MVRTLSEILTPESEEAIRGDSDQFFPQSPDTLEKTGLNQIFVEDLICKLLLSRGSLTGRQLSNKTCLPLKIFSDLLYDLKQRLILAYQSTSGVNDFEYILTEKGRQKALLAREQSNYIGSAPVPFQEYLESIEKQSIRKERPGREQLEKAFEGLIVSNDFLSSLGPAVNSRRGLFLYGEPGNGKTEIATRIARCFANAVYIPKTFIVEGELIQLYDPQCHELATTDNINEQETSDQRWVKIKRPAVVVGGEMNLDSLEIGYNEKTKICEASLQLKGNSGVFVIDDFGRQRVAPDKLLNRWILPLEKRIDYLTLPSGNKIRVPFNALLVFCSNLDPGTMLEEALLRRIPYKIRMTDPSEEGFITILKNSAKQFNIPYDKNCVEYLLEKHFRNVRPMRGCHPRDILQQLVNLALYENRPPRMTTADIDQAIGLYFTATRSGR